MDILKAEILSSAKENMIDEVRFIDCKPFEPKKLFSERQPLDIMPDGKSIIVTSIYIGNFVLDDFNPLLQSRTSRLTLSGFYANIVNPLVPIQKILLSKGFKAYICDGVAEENSIPLKLAAIKAGLGWRGKNTMLLSDVYGSFQALGGIITDADLSEYNKVMEDKCGTCSACIDLCPTAAIEKPYVLNKSKCISNFLEEETIPDLGYFTLDNYFFECDTCQNICPWNTKHIESPLLTPMGETFDLKYKLSELFSFKNLLKIDKHEYEDKILPLLSGFDLSYEMFKRNINLARNIVVKEAYDFIPEIGKLFLEYQQTVNNHICFETLNDEIKNLPGEYAPPKGYLLGLFIKGDLVGCIAFKPVYANICELKRFYLKENFRGEGLGNILLERLIEVAKEFGYEKMVLTTLKEMEKAISLYKSHGFKETKDCYSENDCQRKFYFLDLKG